MKSNVFIRNTKTPAIIIWQIFSFALFIWYYINNSFLRSRCDIKIECILAIVLVIAMAANYWLLYPVFYKRYSFWLYAMVTFVEGALAAILEYCLTINIGLKYITLSVPQSELIHIKLSFFFNILSRDLCLLGFVGLTANNFGQKFRLLEKDRLLLKKENRVIVRKNHEDHIINADTICYLQQQQNETVVFTDDGQQYKKRGAMSFFENNMNNECVRISKSIIVFFSYILSYTDNHVTIHLDTADKDVTLSFGRYVAPSAVNAISNYMKNNRNGDMVRQTAVTEMITGNEPHIFDSKEPTKRISARNKKNAVILEFIANHTECNIHDIVSGTKIPKSTVTRILAELKKDGLIRYDGSKKTGGYRAVGNQQEGIRVEENGMA